MATPKIKATYTLDVDTTRLLEKSARLLGLSKSEVVRRAVRSFAATAPSAGSDALAALDALQSTVSLSESGASRWLESIREEREAFGDREPRER